MVIFHSFLYVYQRVYTHTHEGLVRLFFALQAPAGGIEDAEYGSRLVEQHRQ